VKKKTQLRNRQAKSFKSRKRWKGNLRGRGGGKKRIFMKGGEGGGGHKKSRGRSPRRRTQPGRDQRKLLRGKIPESHKKTFSKEKRLEKGRKRGGNETTTTTQKGVCHRTL